MNSDDCVLTGKLVLPISPKFGSRVRVTPTVLSPTLMTSTDRAVRPEHGSDWSQVTASDWLTYLETVIEEQLELNTLPDSCQHRLPYVTRRETLLVETGACL